MAMAYSRSRMLCAAARLGIADALGDEVRSVGFLAENCQADADALYRLLRALASIGVTEETTPEHFRLTPFGKPLRRDVPLSVWAAVIFWADLLADSWSLLTDCVRTGKPASQVRDPKIPSRWSQDAQADSIFRAVMGTAPAEDYAPIAEAWDFSRAKVVADLGGGGGSLILAVLGLNSQSRFADEDLSSRCELIAADLSQSVRPAPMYTCSNMSCTGIGTRKLLLFSGTAAESFRRTAVCWSLNSYCLRSSLIQIRNWKAA